MGGVKFTLRLSFFIWRTRSFKMKGLEYKREKKRTTHLEPWACDALGCWGCFLASYVVVPDAWHRRRIKTNKYQRLQNCLCFQIKQRKYCFDTRLAVFIACALPAQLPIRLNIVVPACRADKSFRWLSHCRRRRGLCLHRRPRSTAGLPAKPG